MRIPKKGLGNELSLVKSDNFQEIFETEELKTYILELYIYTVTVEVFCHIMYSNLENEKKEID